VKKIVVKTSVVCAFAIGFSLLSIELCTTNSVNAAELEEVVVVARKKEESLQDVPTTIKVFEQLTLERLNINDVKDISEQVPTFQILQRGSGAGAALYLRGIGSNSNDPAFDSAIALNFDDVVSNSSRLISQGNLDMQQVEVLKGPQSLYFGKGATAGVVSIRSKNPGDDFEGSVRFAYEAEEGGSTFEGVLSSPITDTFGARLAVRAIDIDEIAQNTAAGVENAKRGEENKDARLTLAWDPSENFSANLKLSRSEYRNDGSLSFVDIGCAGSSPQPGVYPQASALAVPIIVPNGNDCVLGDQRIQVADQNSIVNQPGGQPGNNNGVPYGSQDFDLARLKLDWQINEALSLTSITSQFDLAEQGFDCFAYDTNGSNCIVTENTVDAFAQELRLAGRLADNVEFLIGGYYQDRDLVHTIFQDALSVPVLLSFLVGSPLAAVDPFTGYTIDWIKRHPTEHETRSVFGSVSWDISEQWNLTAGGRYSDEEKQNIYSTPFVHAGFSLLLPGATATSGFSVPISFEDTEFSPEVSLSYRPDQNTNYYLAYKTGFKSGGVSYSQLPFLADFFALVQGDFSALLFDSETSEGFELGMKATRLNGDLRFNASLYRYIYEDLQNQQFDSTTFVFTTFNAGEVENQGLEVDAIYNLTDALSLRGVFAYTDTEYSSTFVNIAGSDLNGQARQNAPTVAFNLGFDYTKSLSNGLQAYVGATAHYSDDYTTSTSQQASPNEFTQDSYWRADVVASIGAADNRWSVSLVGRNISDETYTVETIGRPGAIPNAFGQRDQAHFINRGRQIFLEGQFRF